MPWANNLNLTPFNVDYSSVWLVYDAVNNRIWSGPHKERAEAEKQLAAIKP